MISTGRKFIPEEKISEKERAELRRIAIEMEEGKEIRLKDVLKD